MNPGSTRKRKRTRSRKGKNPDALELGAGGAGGAGGDAAQLQSQVASFMTELGLGAQGKASGKSKGKTPAAAGGGNKRKGAASSGRKRVKHPGPAHGHGGNSTKASPEPQGYGDSRASRSPGKYNFPTKRSQQAQWGSAVAQPDQTESSKPAGQKKHIFFDDSYAARKQRAASRLTPSLVAGGKATAQKLDNSRWFENPLAKQWPVAVTAPAEPAATGKKRKKKRQQPVPAGVRLVDMDVVNSWKQRAVECLEQLVSSSEDQQAINTQGSDDRFLKQLMRSGTVSDKVAALTLMVHNSPLVSLGPLDKLLAMASRKGQREAAMAIESLRDLFIDDLLPEDRQLRLFQQQPLPAHAAPSTPPSLSKKPRATGETTPTDMELVFWLFEEEVKKRYAMFLEALRGVTYDTLDHVKYSSVVVMHKLLMERPEAERALLGMLVNKLGDPNRKVASKVVFLLNQTLWKHPGMKSDIVKEAERLLFRDNVTERSQYFTVAFLNQIKLSKNDTRLPSQLIVIYLSLFRQFALRSGIERAEEEANSAPTQGGKGRAKGKNRGKGRKKKGGKGGKGNVRPSKQGDLNTKMLSALLIGINRAFPYARLEDEVYDKQADSLFRVVHQAPFNTSVQALMLLYQVSAARKAISDRYYRALYAKLLDRELAATSKRESFLNLLYKSLKDDVSGPRVAAFAKRLLQVCLFQTSVEFVCGALFVLSEVTKHQPSVKWLLTQTESTFETDDENFVDADAVDATADADKESPAAGDAQGYDMAKRDPEYARAQYSCLRELNELTHHYHPSVVKWATSLLNGESIEYGGDPLKDFTQSAFLDRFVYRNPKKKLSHEYRKKRGDLSFQRSVRPQSKLLRPAANTEAFLKLPEEKVQEDEKFLHMYFQERARRGKTSKGQHGPAEHVEMDEDEEEAFAEEIISKEMDKYDKSAAVDIDDEDLDDWMESEDENDTGAVEDDGAAGGAFETVPSEDDDDEAAEEAAAAAAAFGDVDSDDSGDDDDDTGDAKNTFAAFEDFANVLEDAGKGPHLKQLAWENKNAVVRGRSKNRSKGKSKRKKRK